MVAAAAHVASPYAARAAAVAVKTAAVKAAHEGNSHSD